MENDQEVKVSTEPKRRGRPPKAVEEKVEVASEVVQEIEETVSDNTVEVKQPKIITQTVTQIIDEEPLEGEGINIPEDEIFEVEEINEVEDGYSVRYKYKRGEQVWVANWGHKLEGDRDEGDNLNSYGEEEHRTVEIILSENHGLLHWLLPQSVG